MSTTVGTWTWETLHLVERAVERSRKVCEGISSHHEAALLGKAKVALAAARSLVEEQNGIRQDSGCLLLVVPCGQEETPTSPATAGAPSVPVVSEALETAKLDSVMDALARTEEVAG
jgi:hypothetical protein